MREHETLTFLIMPLLLALGWAEQQAVRGRRAHQMWSVEICLCRMDFSRWAWAEIR